MLPPCADEPGGKARQVGRRTFVVTVAASAVTICALPALALASPALAAAGELDGSAGVVMIGGTAKALCLQGRRWVLVDESGTVQSTSGLDNAVVVDITSDAAGLVAVGSLRSGTESTAAIWESADGIVWREASRLNGMHAEFTAVGTSPDTVMALGSMLTHEHAPAVRIAARRTARGWVTMPVRGLEWTDELSTTALAGGSGGWVAAAADVSGTVLYTSRDGFTWSPVSVEPRLDDAAVGGLVFVGGQIQWVANAFGGSSPLAGTLGTGRRTVPVPEHAHAVGIVPTSQGVRSFWLADGRLVAANV